jgi:5-hydroxyisourate hydrolase
MAESPTISTHVLDTEHGQPARGVAAVLYRVHDGGEEQVGRGTTDDDGRIRRLLDGALEIGTYRLAFELDGPFFREARVTFVVDDASRNYHVPLLLAPYSLSTYRGS